MKRAADRPDISLVIPAYREEKRLAVSLQELAAFIKSSLVDLSVETIIVVADSPDATLEIARQYSRLFDNYKIIQSGKKLGKGHEVQVGMLASNGNYVLFMDADLATPLTHIPAFYELCKAKGGMVIATRNIRKYHRNWIRYAYSNVGNLLFRLTSGIWLEDTQCGFKMFSHDAARICFTKQTIMGWDFDMDILAIARVNHLPIEAVRVNDWRNKLDGTFEDSILKNALHSAHNFARILLKRMTGRYHA